MHYSAIRPATRIPSANCNCPDIQTWMKSAKQSPRNPLAASSSSARAVPRRASGVQDLRGLRVPSSIETSFGSALSTVAIGVGASPLNCPRQDSLGTAASLKSPQTSVGTPQKRRTATWASAAASCSSSASAETPNAINAEPILPRCCRSALSNPWHSEWVSRRPHCCCRRPAPCSSWYCCC